MCCNCLLFWQQVICFKSLNLEQVTSKYSERLYLCLNNYHCNLDSKFNHLFHSLNVIECTFECQYISVTLYLLQTYPSGEPLFKGQGLANPTTRRARCFYDYIYITFILLLCDLTTLCVVDHLWPLTSIHIYIINIYIYIYIYMVCTAMPKMIWAISEEWIWLWGWIFCMWIDFHRRKKLVHIYIWSVLLWH